MVAGKDRALAIRAASATDVAAIHRVLHANASDASLFQQSERRVTARLADFVVGLDHEGALVACAALHRHADASVEILAVAVSPSAHGTGIGSAMMRTCVDRANESGATSVWLATQKPEYFARFGFKAFTRWQLPLRVLLYKLSLIFEQPISRWLPALFGRHTFMRL